MNELPTFLGIAPFVPIVALCYFVGAVLKNVRKEELDRFIPDILAFFGGGVAVLLYFTIPGYLPAFAINWFSALILGMVSGAVAVFINQVWKQHTKEDTYAGPFEGEVPNSEFTNENEEDPKKDPDDETTEEE